MKIADQRGRARFVFGEVHGLAACPLPNLLDSGKFRDCGACPLPNLLDSGEVPEDPACRLPICSFLSLHRSPHQPNKLFNILFRRIERCHQPYL